MPRRSKYVFRFPARLIGRPVASELVSRFGLVVNILRARIEPDEEGMLVVELTGLREDIKRGLEHVRECGLTVEPLDRDITWHRDLCVECTACRSVCPTGAITVEGPEMKVDFDRRKCIACELCITACPYKALEIQF